MWYSAFSLRSPSATAFLISAGNSVVSSCSSNLISSASLFFTSSGIGAFRTILVVCAQMLAPQRVEVKERLYDGRTQKTPLRVARTAEPDPGIDPAGSPGPP